MKPSAKEFERLALEQLDLLYRVACRLCGKRDQASDLVQETYVRALRSRNTFDLKAVGIRPWLVRIMHNLHVTRAQREQRQPSPVDVDTLVNSGASGPAVTFSADKLDYMDERVVQALHELPAEYQVALLLWAVEEFSYKEIADSLQIPIGTVMSRLHRAKQRLAELLRGFAREIRVVRE